MAQWGSIRLIPVGGLVAVGFLDEQRIVVGMCSSLEFSTPGMGRGSTVYTTRVGSAQ